MQKSNRWLAVLMIAALLMSGGMVPAGAAAPAGCDDGVCPVPLMDENNQPVYAIVSPVGYHAVDMIAQAPRLDTLAGKKIALVGGSFMASVTHEELRKCILETYPTAEVYMF